MRVGRYCRNYKYLPCWNNVTSRFPLTGVPSIVKRIAVQTATSSAPERVKRKSRALTLGPRQWGLSCRLKAGGKKRERGGKNERKKERKKERFQRDEMHESRSLARSFSPNEWYFFFFLFLLCSNCESIEHPFSLYRIFSTYLIYHSYIFSFLTGGEINSCFSSRLV